MTYDLYIALAVFAFVTSITPGPNNIMLMTSGVNFGFYRTIPHMLGVGIGFVVMVLGVGSGLASIFQSWPTAHDILKIVSTVYLLWLAWRIATQPVHRIEAGSAARPLTFLEAAAFQWVNPKAWAMALTAVTAYSPDRELATILLVAIVFGAINLPAVGSWTLLGEAMSGILRKPARLRAFNIAMAVLLVASLWPLVMA
ncbi:MAG: LysE family translocator [Pseudomonadota bacterium]